MSEPFDLVRVFHDAFRRDMMQIDDSVLSSVRSGGDITASLDRFHVMGEVLGIHARGEEASVFPAVDKVAPLVSSAYVMDHRELDAMVDAMEEIRKTRDPLSAARATAVFKSHQAIHLRKEDVYLYPLLKERTTEGERASIIGSMGKVVPHEKYPTVVQWLYPSLSLEDRIVITKVWMSVMPPQVFGGFKLLIEKAIPDEWVELTRQIPELNDK